jgi:hypothetical protein
MPDEELRMQGFEACLAPPYFVRKPLDLGKWQAVYGKGKME